MGTRRKIQYYRLVWLKYDLPAGLYVFFVALPLCLSIAIASGAPPAAGIMSGIIGGLIVPLISGSQLSVAGPAAGLSTVVAAGIISLGDYRAFLVSLIIAGLFQIILGVLKLGTVANYFPSAVIKGMLAAIGIILISKQIPIALGYNQPDFWSSGFLNVFKLKNFFGSVNNFYLHTSRMVVFITIISLAILILYQFKFARRLKVVPAPLLVVGIGIMLNMLFMQLFKGSTLRPVTLVNVPENIFSALQFPEISHFLNPAVYQNGIIICMLASLETLLCVEAIDKLDEDHRVTPVNRELVAQGIGNSLCGLLGAIPMTAVIVRGAANVDAGARTKLSSFTHGFFLLVTAISIPFVINRIPNASLAAILLITGYNLTKPKLYRNMFSLGWKQFLPFMLTIVVILLTDLLIGVTIGLILSTYFIVVQNMKEEYNLVKTVEGNNILFELKLNPNVTFLNKVKIRNMLDEIPGGSTITIDGTASDFVDYDVLEIISEFEEKAKRRNIQVNLMNLERVNVTSIH